MQYSNPGYRIRRELSFSFPAGRNHIAQFRLKRFGFYSFDIDTDYHVCISLHNFMLFSYPMSKDILKRRHI